jgi:hypothetical protein
VDNVEETKFSLSGRSPDAINAAMKISTMPQLNKKMPEKMPIFPPCSYTQDWRFDFSQH